MNTISEVRRRRLLQLADEAGSMTALNLRLGRPSRDSTLSQIKNQSTNSKGGKPKTMGDAMARGIELALGLPEGWMDNPIVDNATRNSSPPNATINRVSGFTPLYENTDIVTISRYDTGGSMGAGVVLHDQAGVIDSWRVSKQWLSENVRGYTSTDNLSIVTGFGDSMRPTYNPGDPLIVDRGVKSVDFDSVYFFRVGNDGYVKRLQRVPTAAGLIYRAISDNRAYGSFDIDSTMDFEVLARVIQVWRREDY